MRLRDYSPGLMILLLTLGTCTPTTPLSVIYEPAEGLLSSKGLSRRQCFKIAMAFYDPLGLGVEYAVALRAMVREACSSSVGWDDLVESSLAAKLVKEASKAAVIGDFTYLPTSTSPLSPTDQPAEDDCRVCAPIEVDTRNSDPRVQDLANFFDESTIKDLQQRHLKTRAIIATLRAGPDNEKAPNLRCYFLVDGVLHYTGVTSLVNDRTRAEVSLPVLPVCQTSTSTSTPPQETTGNTNATLPATNPTGQTSTSSSTPPQETTGNTNATLPATNPAGQTSTSSSAPPQETAGNTNPILPATVNLPHTSITATSPAVVPPNPAVGPPTDTASGDQPTGSGSSSPRVNLVDYTSYYHHYEDTSRYHNSDNDWYYSHGWKKKGTRSDVKKIYNDVAWMKHVLGQPWKGSGDSCSLLEFRNKLTCSAEYKWADPCSRYFILKHNLSESIQRLLDGYEADNEVDMARFSDPLGSDSPYWLECSEQVWSFLERTYAGLDGDRLEERWSSQWLSKGSTWLEFYSTFDSVGRQLAKSRGIERLSDQEQRCRLYQALPHACQVYLNERGYRQVGSMPFPKMIECVQAWCETHWDHKQVKVTALSTDTKERWNGYEDRSNYSKDIGGNISTGALPEKRGYRKFPPRSQRLREDAKILADDYNKSVLAAKCGRCLSSEGGHTAISCCQQLDRPEIRCPFCGLKHSDYQLCPQDFDTYGKDCGRCGRRHHGPWACKAPTPSSRVISAVSLSPMSVEDPVLTVTLDIRSLVFGAEGLGVGRPSTYPLTLTTADWSRPSVKGIIKNLPVYLPQGRVVYLDFLVSAQDLTRQVILSASFLRELDAVWLVGKSRLIFEAGANGITQQLYNLGRPTSSSKPVDPALQGVVELCNLALSTTAESTSTPVLPDDLATDIVTSQFPSDQSKELTAGAVVPSVIPTHEGHDSDDFTWDLAPPTPRSKLGRFVLHVPWKGDDRPTGGYNSTAARRAFSTDARLSASERSDYLEVVRGLVEEGFVVPADEDVVALHKTLGPDDSHKSTVATDYQEPVSSHVGIYVDDTHARGETKEEALYYADRLDSGLASHGFWLQCD
ncbi:hypothetical protein FOZ60_006106 [Perkinsus olseni]|uniref:Uncharacterized protein n=1 Tax=Perkinsus olseni TaxID=32597 RepID=A0A7J6NRV8_PEROL|nr:hypothetical protein FOZ60_006106 [Perkinsus olseni]